MGMQLPSYDLLTQAATAGVVAGRLQPAVVVVRLDPARDPADPGTLLGRCVAFRTVTHPALAAEWSSGGGQVTGDGWLFSTRQENLPDLLGRVVPGCWPSPARVSRVLPADVAGNLEKLGGFRRPPRLMPSRLAVSRTRSGFRVTVSLDRRVSELLPTGPVPPAEALNAVSRLRAAGVVVVDASGPERLPLLWKLVRRRVVATPMWGRPGMADLDVGPDASCTAPAGVGSTLDVLAATGSAVGVVAVDPYLTAVAALADPVPVCHPNMGLYRWQEQFVDRYVAAAQSGGLVNALEPGLGKTACASAALEARWRQADRPTSQALVVCPSTVRGQWVAELGTFFPQAQVTSGVSASSTVGLRVVVCSPQFVVRNVDRLAAVNWSDVVVDEGAFLASGSKTAAALFRIRAVADMGMVLTGTPPERPGRLVEFATGRPCVADVTVDECGPWWFFGPSGVQSGVLPGLAVEIVDVPPGLAERRVSAAASELLGSQSGFGLHRSSVERSRRLGLASPVALSRSGFKLAAAVPKACRPGVKVRWVASRAASEIDLGGRVLVFSDFAGVLGDVSAELDAVGVAHGVLSSAVPPAGRAAVVEGYLSGAVPVLLAAPTGHHGVNLPGATLVVHADVPDSYDGFVQRNARATRAGGGCAQVVRVAVPVVSGTADALSASAFISPG